MKALRQLGFLKLNLRPAEVPLEEDHRVLALFRNRAELKKAYGDLQEETFRLKDLVKQQEGATQRVQEMLNTLEGRLGVADTAYPALVFYQLRHLWQTGRELVAAFIADLARQQEERERRAHLAQHNRQQFARRQSAEAELQAAQGLQVEGHTQLEALQAERTKLTRLWTTSNGALWSGASVRRSRRSSTPRRRLRRPRRTWTRPCARPGRSSRDCRCRPAAPSTSLRSPVRRCCACASPSSRRHWSSSHARLSAAASPVPTTAHRRSACC